MEFFFNLSLKVTLLCTLYEKQFLDAGAGAYQQKQRKTSPMTTLNLLCNCDSHILSDDGYTK